MGFRTTPIYIYTYIYIYRGFSIAMFDYWSVILQTKPMEISNNSDAPCDNAFTAYAFFSRLLHETLIWKWGTMWVRQCHVYHPQTNHHSYRWYVETIPRKSWVVKMTLFHPHYPGNGKIWWWPTWKLWWLTPRSTWDLGVCSNKATTFNGRSPGS